MDQQKAHRKRLEEIWFCLIIVLFLTIYVWVEILRTDKDACSGPAWPWMIYAGAYFSLALIDSLIDLKRETGSVNFLKKFPRLMKPTLDMGLIILFIGSIISFVNLDDCSDLGNVVKVVFAITLLALAIPFFCFCKYLHTLYVSKKFRSAGEVINGLKPSNNPGVRILFRSSSIGSSLKPDTNDNVNQPNKEIQLANQNQDQARLNDANQKSEDRL